MNSRLAVIVVADIVGYSGMMARDENAGIKAVHDVHDAHLVPLTGEHSGEILKRMGDGWIIAFGSITGAIKCATRLQTALAGGAAPKLRIGAHLGEIVQEADEFFGAGVNLAARLQAEAPPGGIMISGDLYRQLTGNLASQFESSGPLTLKNIPAPVDGYRWAPEPATSQARDTRPVVVVEKIEFAPGDADTESAAQELRDQLLMNLARRTGIRVVDALAASAPEPTYVLRGRLRMAGTRARLSISMILCETGEPAFSQNYQGNTDDIFAFFDDTVAKVNSDMRNYLNLHDAERLKGRPVEEMGAWDLLSLAAHLTNDGTYKGWSRAGEMVERALKLDPDLPMALGMRAMIEMAMAAARFEDLDPEFARRTETDLNRAIAALPQSDYLYVCRAALHLFWRRDLAAAMRDCRHALSINPNYYFGQLFNAQVLAARGEFAEAVEQLERIAWMATEDAYEPTRLSQLAYCHFAAGQFEAALAAIEDNLHLRPQVWTLWRFKAIVLRKLGRDDEARAADKMTDGLPKEPSVWVGRPVLPPEHSAFLAELAPTVGF